MSYLDYYYYYDDDDDDDDGGRTARDRSTSVVGVVEVLAFLRTVSDGDSQ